MTYRLELRASEDLGDGRLVIFTGDLPAHGEWVVGRRGT
jgi:hypothetical protein